MIALGRVIRYSCLKLAGMFRHEMTSGFEGVRTGADGRGLMKTTYAFRAAIGAVGMLAATVSLSGCMGGPTYGTDKTAMAQLGDDLGAAVALGSARDEEKEKLRYNPRPTLVVAGKGQACLPAPQQSLANRESNPNWVESPEETRARLRLEAKENEGNNNYRSPLMAGRGQGGQMTETEKWEAFRKAKQDVETVNMGSRRRSLSEPPAEFRAADAATLQDLGEPENEKERRRKKEAQSATQASNSSWWKPFQ